MKTTLSSSIIKARTADRLRPRQLEESHPHHPGRGLGRVRRCAVGALRGGAAVARRVEGAGVESAMGRAAVCGARAAGPSAEGGRSRLRLPLFPTRGRQSARRGCERSLQTPPGHERAVAACDVGACCGTAFPAWLSVRRWAGGHGAAQDWREGRRRVTFSALPRCGPSWGFA